MFKRIAAAALAALALFATAGQALADTMPDPNSTEERNRVLQGYNY